MRGLTLIIVLAVLSMHSMAQAPADSARSGRSEIMIAPLGLVMGEFSKLRIRYQYRTSSSIDPGIDLRFYYGKYSPGYRISPFLKLFTDRTYRQFYIYGMVFYGQNKNYPDDYRKYYLFYGGGAGIGVEWGKKAVWDIAFGLKKVITNASVPAIDRSANIPFGSSDLGQEGTMDGIIAVGFRF